MKLNIIGITNDGENAIINDDDSDDTIIMKNYDNDIMIITTMIE